MSVMEPTPTDPRAADAAEALATAAWRAFKRSGDYRRLARTMLDGLDDLAALAAGKRRAEALRALERRTQMLVELAQQGPTKPLRRPPPRPRRHLLADDDDLIHADE